MKKRSHIEKFIPHIAEALHDLLGLKKADIIDIENNLKIILEKERGEIEEVGIIDNPDYDEEFANIGKEDTEEGKENGEDK